MPKRGLNFYDRGCFAASLHAKLDCARARLYGHGPGPRMYHAFSRSVSALRRSGDKGLGK